MKKIILSSIIAISLALSSCDDKLDITPKGMTTLGNVSDLELILKQEYLISSVNPLSDLGMVCNDGFPAHKNIPGLLSVNTTIGYAYTAWDETVDRALLTESDARYETLYQYIYYSNVVTQKAPSANGSDDLRKLIIAEASVKRAYFHYLLANIYASQYDAATASSTGGIPYVDYVNMEQTKVKHSLADVYSKMLRDCGDNVISDLPDYVPEFNRADKAFGNAVRAKILLQMKDYSEAEKYARAALRYNDNLEDRSVIASTRAWRLKQESPDNYLFIGILGTSLSFTCMSKEMAALASPNNFLRKYDFFLGIKPAWQDSKQNYGFAGGLFYQSMFGVTFNHYGIRTEDMYYIIAECAIRDGRVDDGLDYIDKIELRRIENYTPVKGTGLTASQAMKKLQDSKKIEMYGTCNNFFDCKRWNSEPEYKATITRDLGEYGTFSISPDSPLWIMPFPANATRYNPTLTQNY